MNLCAFVVYHCHTSKVLTTRRSNEDGTWRTSVFYNVLGESYIPIALEAARVADPNAKLYVNDYNFEYGGAKFTAVLNLTKKLKAAGAPLDGIGFQGHLIVGSTPGNIADLFSQLTAEGVEVRLGVKWEDASLIVLYRCLSLSSISA